MTDDKTSAQRAHSAAVKIYRDAIDTGMSRPPDDSSERTRQMNDTIMTWTKIIEVANG